MVIYVDVLFVVNFFITYLLLLLTSLLLKRSYKLLRLLASAAVGGLYSLVILVEDMNFLVGTLGRLLVSLLLVFIAFGFCRLTVFLKSAALFYFSNLIFLGIIVGAQLLFFADKTAVNNGTVYFDIPAKVLLLSALCAYLISVAVIKIYNHTIEKKQIYTLTISKNSSTVHLFALSDSGNKLKEPFSDFPVIVADKSRLSFDGERIVPYNTVGGEGILQAFRPDKVIISNGKSKFETDRVYIAMSDIESKDFSAIINPEILNI